MAWAIQDLTDHYTQGHRIGAPIMIVAAIGSILAFHDEHGKGPWLILLAGVAAGVAEHVSRPAIAESDVLAQIVAASRLFWAGHDPYLVPANEMVGGRYLYPPGPLLLYGAALKLVGAHIPIEAVERAAGVLTVLVLAATARWADPSRAALVATLFGTYLFGAFRSLDGDSNTTLALVFIVGIALLMRAERDDRKGRSAYWLSIPVLALGVLLKQLAWPLYFFIAVHLWSTSRGRRHVVATLAIVVLAIVPFALDDPGAVARMVLVVANKQAIYGLNVLGAVQMIDPQLARTLLPVTVFVQLIGAVVVALLILRTGSRDLPEAAGRAVVVMFVLMVFSSWTSPAYYTFMGTLVLFVIAVAGTRRSSERRGLSLADIVARVRWITASVSRGRRADVRSRGG